MRLRIQTKKARQLVRNGLEQDSRYTQDFVMYGNVNIPMAYASVQGVYQRLMVYKKH